MSQLTTARADASDRSDSIVITVVCAACIAGLFGFIFFEFIERQVLWAIRDQADWGHTLIIPFIAGYFVYLKRDKLLARPFKTTWIGFIPIILGIGWYSICTLGPQMLQHHNLQAAGFALTFTGLVLLFFGYRAMLWLWFPLVYFFLFGQTISERFMQMVTFKLQDITAHGAYGALVLFGVDVDRAGNTLTVYNDMGQPKPLNVAEACSGMRMLMAFLALGVAMAFTGLTYFWQQAVLVLMGVPTAIFVNILRVMTLSLLAMVNSDFAAGDFHSFVGLVWLVPAFLIYLGIMWIVRKMVIDETSSG